MKRYLPLLILFLLNVACKKDEPTPTEPTDCPSSFVFRGRVTDSLTGNPVAGVLVSRSYGVAWPLPIFYSGLSDTNGYYLAMEKFNPCAGSPRPDYVDMYAGLYYHYYGVAPAGVNTTNLGSGDTIEVNFQVVPYSKVLVHIVGSTTNGDVLSVRPVRGSAGFYSNERIVLGSTVDTVITYYSYSYQTRAAYLYVNDSPAQTPYTGDSVLTGYGTTEQLELNYP